MSKYEKQIAVYNKQSRNMFLALTAITVVIALNAFIVTTGFADSYFTAIQNWL